MTSVLSATDYAAVGDMDNAITRSRKENDRERTDRKKSKRDGSKRTAKLVDDSTVDPLAAFYNEHKQRSSSPPAAYTVEVNDGGEADYYSDDDRQHRPPSSPSPPPPTTTTTSSIKKPRRSTSNKRRSNKPTSPPHDSRSASPSDSSAAQQSFTSSDYAAATLPVSYAGRWSADESLALRGWLRDNHFDDTVWEALSEYSIADMLAVTKEDLKELLGTKQGIRLYARIQQYKQQQQHPLNHTSPPQPSRRSYSSASHSRYGGCAVNGCSHASTNVCNMPSCNAALCMAHQHKSLLTGHVYCSSCEGETWEGKVRHSLQTVGERAEETTERIINTTAEWTGTSGREYHSTLPTTSRYGHATNTTPPQPHHSSTASSYHYQEEHKQHSPIPSPHYSVDSSHNTASAGGGGGGLGFMGHWLQRGDGVEELDGGGSGGGYYRERSWNDGAMGQQCSIQ